GGAEIADQSVASADLASQSVTPAKLAGCPAVGDILKYTAANTWSCVADSNPVVEARDYGAKCDGIADDTAAIQAAIDNNYGTIRLPFGICNFTSLTIHKNNVFLEGHGMRTTLRHTGSGDGVVYSPADPTDPAALLAGTGIRNIAIKGSAIEKAGSALKVVKNSGFTLENFVAADHKHLIHIQGGKDGRYNNFRLYYSGTGAHAPDASMLKIEPQPNAGGGYSLPWTTFFSNFAIVGNFSANAAIEINGGDGLEFANAYIGGSFESILKIKNAFPGAFTAAVSFNNTYFDCISNATGTLHAVSIEEDGLPGTHVTGISFSGGFIGNCTSRVVQILESETRTVSFAGVHIANTPADGVLINSPSATVSFAGGSVKNAAMATVGGAGIAIQAAKSVAISGMTLTEMDNTNSAAIKMSGTLGSVAISGNAFVGNTLNIVNTATFTGAYKQTGNVASSGEIREAVSEVLAAETVTSTDASGRNFVGQMSNDGASSYPSFVFQRSGGAVGSETATTSSMVLGQLMVQGHTGSAYDAARRAISFLSGESWSSSSGAYGMAFFTRPPGALGSPVATMRLSSAANVGIGTSAPGARLQVAGGVCVNASATCSDPGAGNLAVTGTLSAGGGSPGRATCWKAGGVLGYCSSALAANGTCTCN
ncbi:MAG: hypothetical protein HY901_15850, partial [Deltaproteobacteria bacterium]|nr:hypothetical protein [Deltaproteobacteria bacterium]